MTMLKKIFSVFMLIFTLLTIGHAAQATSGACSSHGGVNCTVISLRDNSAICNDGWVSSVQYSDMVECNQDTNQTYCIPPKAYTYTTSAQCASVQMQLIRNGSNRYAPDIAGGVLQNCKDEVSKYQEEINNYEDCLNSAPKNKPAPIAISNSERDSYINSEMQKYCIENYGPNSFNDEHYEKCSCNTGYKLNNDGNYCVKKVITVTADKVKTETLMSTGTPSTQSTQLQEVPTSKQTLLKRIKLWFVGLFK